MRNIVGPPVRGKNLYGRERFVEQVWRKVEAGSVLLAAPRRFGKTSIMYRLIDEPRNGFKIVHADLEHRTDPADLMVELVEKLSKDNQLSHLFEGIAHIAQEVWTGLRDTVDEVEAFDVKLKLREQLKPHWQEIGRQVFKRVNAAGQPVLFILDEFPMMIDRMVRNGNGEEARTLLRWLRALRISPEMQNVRFLIAGSIGIDAVLNSLGEISAINDFQKLTLEPFTPEVGDAFLMALESEEKVPLSSQCRARILEKVGILVPYFLQILFAEVANAYWQNGEEPTPETIDRVYRDNVLGMGCKTYFDHYYGRLSDYYGKQDEKAAKRLLRELASVGEMSRDACLELYRETVGSGSGLEEDFNVTLANLENDFYLRYDADSSRYEFSCKLLRDWWLRHYGREGA